MNKPANVSDTVWKQACDVFRSEEKAVRWLGRHSMALGKTPTALLCEEGGEEQVLNELGRIEHGVF